jgi:succinylarginine dihydrolase
VSAVEVNFDGLVGPTHNYGGLSHGNLASAANQGEVSNPREAALQGLAKMRTLMKLGVPQAVLPPHERPHVSSLRRMGFGGSDADVIRAAAKASPVLLANASSASAMWTANAATVSPSADTGDDVARARDDLRRRDEVRRP